MLFVLLSLVLGDTRVGNLPPYQWPGDKGKSAQIGPSGTIAWRDDGSAKNAVLDCPGVDPTGMTYSDVGINACIAAAGPSGDPNGGALYFPRGVYKLQNPIDLVKRMVIYGDGMTNTWFYMDPGTTGVIVRYACEGGPCTSNRGDLSVIHDVGFEYALNASPWVANQAVGLGYVAYGSTGPSNLSLTQVFRVTTAGTTASTEPTWGSANEGDFVTDGTVTWQAIAVACIRLNSRATIRNVMCDRSSGNGILIEASTPFKNANSWFLDNVYLQQARLNGMYVQGADTNAGLALATHSGSNRLWGIYDNSFLGNTYEGCSTEANGLGAYAMVGAAATNILNGCYSEGGQPPTQLKGFSMAVGGLHGAGWSDDSGAFRMSPGNNFETSSGGIHFRDLSAPSGAHIDMPYAGDYLMNLTNTVEGVVGFTIQAGNTPTNAGWWNWRHANLDARSFMRWGGSAADVPYGIWFPGGVYLSNRSFLESGGSAPSWPASPNTSGSLRINTSLFPQSGFNAGIFGWEQAGNNSSDARIYTLRWPHFGNANEKVLTANGVGSPYAFNYLTDSGLQFTNSGATAKQYITLTTQAFNPDLRYTELYIHCDDADGIRVTAGSNTISYGSQITSSGGYLESTTPGSWLKLKASSHVGTWWSWNVTEISGTWTDGTQTFSPGASAPSGTYVLKAGDTMTGPLVAASGITVATGHLTLGATSALNVNSGLLNFSDAVLGSILIDNNSGYGLVVVDDLGNEFIKVDTATDLITLDEGDIVLGSSGSGKTLTCYGDTTFNGSVTIRDHGELRFRNTINGENILSLPTGQTEGLVINDTSGQWYGHFDTLNKTFNFDVVSGYNGAVYMNQGTLNFNASSGSNIIAMNTGLAEGLDIKDTGGNYYVVFNTSTQSIASGKPWSLSSNVGYAFPSHSPSGTTQTIDWNNGINVSVDTSSASGNVTLTLNNPSLGARYVIMLATGASARALVFPASVLLVSPPTPGATQKYKYDLVWNGTNYFGTVTGPY